MATKEEITKRIQDAINLCDEVRSKIKTDLNNGLNQKENIENLFLQQNKIFISLETFKNAMKNERLNGLSSSMAFLESVREKIEAKELPISLDESVETQQPQQLDNTVSSMGPTWVDVPNLIEMKPIVHKHGNQDWDEKCREIQGVFNEVNFLKNLSKVDGFTAEGSKRTSEINNIQETLKTIYESQEQTFVEKTQLARGCLLQHRRDLGIFDHGKLAKRLDALLKAPALQTGNSKDVDMAKFNKMFSEKQIAGTELQEPPPKGSGIMQKLYNIIKKKEPLAYLDTDTKPSKKKGPKPGDL